jgi:hypothetical protein
MDRAHPVGTKHGRDARRRTSLSCLVHDLCGVALRIPTVISCTWYKKFTEYVTEKIKHLCNKIVIRCRLVGPGIEYRWVGETFRTLPDSPSDPPNFLYNGYQVYFPGGKVAGAWR